MKAWLYDLSRVWCLFVLTVGPITLAETTAQGDNSVRFGCLVKFSDSLYDATRYNFLSDRPKIGWESTNDCESNIKFTHGSAFYKSLVKVYDSANLVATGVDPATLRAQSVDLDFFPSYPISDQLTLKPSLSYGEDSWYERIGLLNYGAPKKWSNHYGELIFMIARSDSDPYPLSELKTPGGAPEGQRHSQPQDLQIYFINATGQEMNFYPDPNASTNNKWTSTDGQFRLHDNATQPDSMSLELKSATGLTYSSAIPEA